MTIINLILGVLFGVVGKIIYDKIQKSSDNKRIKELLIVEMTSNLKNLNEILKDIKTIDTSPVREHLQPFTLEETATKICDACKNNHFQKCIEKLPLLGTKKIKNVVTFYNEFESEAKFLRDYPRFGGCISTHTNENVINRLVATCEKELKEFKNK